MSKVQTMDTYYAIIAEHDTSVDMAFLYYIFNRCSLLVVSSMASFLSGFGHGYICGKSFLVSIFFRYSGVRGNWILAQSKGFCVNAWCIAITYG